MIGNVGALSDKIVVDERGLVVIPDDMPMDLASLLGCAVVTGLGSVFNVAKVRPGDTVAVLGCGGVGLNVIQGARIAGASRIIAIDVSAGKLDTAIRLGATDTVDASQVDAPDAVVSMTGGGVDHAFEVIGRPSTVAQAMAMTARGRATYVVGVMADHAVIDVRQVDPPGPLTGRGLHGVHPPPARHPPLRRHVATRAARLGRHGVAATALDDVGDGFRALAAGEVTRVVVVFDEAAGIRAGA